MTSTNCPTCGGAVDAALPFCPHCGRAVTGGMGAVAAPEAGSGTLVLSAVRRERSPRMVVLDESGEPKYAFALERPTTRIGRGECDVRFAEDAYLSPLHAELILRDGELFLHDLDSTNRSWVFADGPHQLEEGDVCLVGSQLLRFRRQADGAPGGVPSDGTRRIGSLTPAPDAAVIEQLRADGSVRDRYHLSAGRTVAIGRTTGDWTFPYDRTMSGRHAEIRDEHGQFVLVDAGSRNGVAVAVRGEHPLRAGVRILLGDQLLRVDSL